MVAGVDGGRQRVPATDLTGRLGVSAAVIVSGNEAAFEDWTVAVEANRRHRLDWTQMRQLPVKPAAMTPALTATLKSEMTPADNLIDDGPELATAA